MHVLNDVGMCALDVPNAHFVYASAESRPKAVADPQRQIVGNAARRPSYIRNPNAIDEDVQFAFVRDAGHMNPSVPKSSFVVSRCPTVTYTIVHLELKLLLVSESDHKQRVTCAFVVFRDDKLVQVIANALLWF